jgi:hypothetical protein
MRDEAGLSLATAPTTEAPAGRWFERPDALFAVGVVAWLAATIARWPAGLSFGDEIGYVGQARLLLEGRVHPGNDSPGIWNATPAGPVPQYPLFMPLLLAPLVALWPPAVFLIGVLAAVGLCWTASRALKAWGFDPRWALVLLAHPTMIIIARTVMADVLLSAAAVGAWWALRRGRAVLAVTLLAATMAVKATGFLVAAAIVAGEVAGAGRELWARAPAAVRQLKIGVAGLAAGALLSVGLNVLATGTLWFGYRFKAAAPPFALGYFRTTAPVHALALLLNPPLLLLGLAAFWRRRLVGPTLVIVGLTAMMSFYNFVDSAPTWSESLVLSQRLILPVVAFLLIGYAAGLARVAARLRVAQLAAALLVVAPAGLAFAIGSRHRGWQAPMRQARAAAAEVAKQTGARELGLTFNACKAGLLFDGRTTLVTRDNRPPVVLCATRGMSYRKPEAGDDCALPGYHEVRATNGYGVLVRDPAAPGGAAP